jgi:hypothetical protein
MRVAWRARVGVCACMRGRACMMRVREGARGRVRVCVCARTGGGGRRACARVGESAKVRGNPTETGRGGAKKSRFSNRPSLPQLGGNPNTTLN